MEHTPIGPGTSESGPLSGALNFLATLALIAARIAGFAAPVAVGLIAVPCRAQPTSFEVASVRPNKQPLRPWPNVEVAPPPPPPPAVRTSPESLTILNASLRYCLIWAYGVKPWQVSGPDWMDAGRYDISAKTASPVTVEQLKTMLQTLLSDRFRMALHREKKDAPVMALVVARGGPKLTAAAPGSAFRQDLSFPPAGIQFSYHNAGLEMLEGPLSGPGWPPVLNMTGITGRYDFTYVHPRRDPENPDSWFGDIQAALQRQLGLQLERRTAPVEIIVVDRAEKIPTEN